MICCFFIDIKMVIKYLFFDFDGTVSDARRVTYETMCDTFESMKFKFSKSKLKKQMGYKTPLIIKNMNLDFSKVDMVRKLFYKKLVNKKNLNKLNLCVDVEGLWGLSKEGYKLIVVSNSDSKFLKSSIKVLGLKGLFFKVYGSDKFSTKDELLKRLLKKYNIQKKDTIYVGDRFSDISYAHRAHMHAVAIHNKCAWSTLSEITKEDPDYLIHDFNGLKELIEKLNQ